MICKMFKFSDLVPIPMPNSNNSDLLGPKDICYAHIFFKDEGVDNLEYVSSVSGEWGQYFKLIQQTLLDNQRPSFNIHVGIVNPDPLIPTDLSPIESFFTENDSFRKGHRIMILVVSADSNRKQTNNFLTDLILIVLM